MERGTESRTVCSATKPITADLAAFVRCFASPGALHELACAVDLLYIRTGVDAVCFMPWCTSEYFGTVAALQVHVVN